MAERPVFLPSSPAEPRLVEEHSFAFEWHPGFSATQKKKNVAALHRAAARSGWYPLLEISTKSDEELGRRLSAFYLKVESTTLGKIPLECAFQGSKVFECGGPYTDLYSVDARTAKRDRRIAASGRLLRFDFEGTIFECEPKTAFYDWLYLNAVFPHREWLRRLFRYRGFTDIEFNPARSINCQARSCALFVALMWRKQLERSLSSKSTFLQLLVEHHVPSTAEHQHAAGSRLDLS